MGLTIYILQPITYKFLQNWNVVLLILIGMAVYGALLLATKVVDKNMLAVLRQKEAITPPENIHTSVP